MSRTRTRFMILIAAILCLSISVGYAQQRGKKEFSFKGKIEKVNADAKSLSVNGEKVDGWMSAMTMTYKVDKPEILKTLKVGDTITAKVYEGDFMTLYDVKVEAPPTKK
jgi:Cu/Ag efflux protein CusF